MPNSNIKKKKHKIVRYARVHHRAVRRLRAGKVKAWFNDNIKGHPIISGLLFFFWVSMLMDILFSGKPGSIKSMLQADLAVFLLWLVLVAIANSLKDKEKTRWYFKKKFVFVMTALFYPLGLFLIWAGSKFKNTTKITLTIIFGLLFLGSNFYQQLNKDASPNISSVEKVIKIINTAKKKVYLPKYSLASLSDIKLNKPSQKRREKMAISEINTRYSPGVVSIKTQDKYGKDIGLGSGFVITKNGFIATNYHVVESAYQAEVKIGEDSYREVYLVRAIPQRDLAILKINADGLVPLVIGSSNGLVSGQIVVALGNPLGLEKTVSSGIVSSIRSNKELRLIQMTVPVSMGSSGGPVFDEYGQVVGVTTIASLFFAQNVNFAVPIDYLVSLLNQEK